MRVLFVTLLCTGLLTAQRTWIVDAAGGAGVHFTDLPPAVAAAADGDTILVRPAVVSYRATTVTKGLKLVATGLPVMLDGAPLLVRGIGVGRQCTVAGFWLDPVTSWVGVEACAGVVTLRSLSAGPAAGITMQIRNARSVIVEACQVEGERGAALTVNASSLYCVDCIIRGRDVWPPATGATLGILAADSRLVLAHTAVFGGRVLSTPSYQQPALLAYSGVSVVTGRSTLVGGGPVAVATPYGTDLALDPQTAVVGSIGALVRVVGAQLPALSVRSDRSIRHDGLPGDVAAFFVSLQGAPQLTPFGEQWLDLASAVLVDVGPVGAVFGERTIAAGPLFNLVGANLTAQSLTLRNGGLLWSTPLRVVTP